MDENRLISVHIATAVGLGAIIGAGIFVLSGTSIALAGADALLAFIVVGLVAIILALEMGELSSLMPDVKGASYSYTYLAFGSRLGFITGIFRYLSLAVSISVISLGFGAYLSSILGISGSTYSIPFAILLIGTLSFVNLLGIKKAAETDSFLVVIKIGILLLFIGLRDLSGVQRCRYRSKFPFHLRHICRRPPGHLRGKHSHILCLFRLPVHSYFLRKD